MLNRARVLFLLFACVTSLLVRAEDFIVVGKDAKVFDEPNAKGYVTLNTKNEEVLLTPGMVFKALENAKGWYVIEYSPGLHGYLSEQACATTIIRPKPGLYSVYNAPTIKLNTSDFGDEWSASVENKVFRGKVYGDVVIFFDDEGNTAYSLADFGSGPIVMSYDNSNTKFF